MEIKLPRASESVIYPIALEGMSPVTFALIHTNDLPDVDPEINDDLIGTRAQEDVLGVVPEFATVAAKPSWLNIYHGAYNISNRTQAYKHIVVHYTGSGTSKAGSAKNNCIYFSGGNRNASAHYFIDDGGIWEYADPDTHYTWHCGDGGGKYGISNSQSIGIEVCLDGDKAYTSAEIGYLATLVQWLMAKYNVAAGNVVRHYDASRKECPYYYAKRESSWQALREQITKTANEGWQKDSKGWWWRNSDGSWPYNAWRKVDGYWYYFNASGYAQTGWQELGDYWYYLEPKGGKIPQCAMATGWIQVSGKWYYLREQNEASGPEGSCVTGTTKPIGGKTYEFDAKGVCLNP